MGWIKSDKNIWELRLAVGRLSVNYNKTTNEFDAYIFGVKVGEYKKLEDAQAFLVKSLRARLSITEETLGAMELAKSIEGVTVLKEEDTLAIARAIFISKTTYNDLAVVDNVLLGRTGSNWVVIKSNIVEFINSIRLTSSTGEVFTYRELFQDGLERIRKDLGLEQ